MPTPTKSNDTSIPVGSMVIVTDSGNGYTSYKAMAAFMGRKRWAVRDGAYGGSPTNGKTYRVVAKAIHETTSYGEVLGLEDEAGQQVMIGIRGVRLVEPSKLNLSALVAGLEAQLVAVTKERDFLASRLRDIHTITASTGI